MYCETPEEKNMLEALKLAYPDASPYVLELNVWMYFNKRDEYVKLMDDLMEKYGDNPELIPADDERLRSLYPKEPKVIPPVYTTPDGEEMTAPTLSSE
jgi:hypothetical protein